MEMKQNKTINYITEVSNKIKNTPIHLLGIAGAVISSVFSLVLIFVFKAKFVDTAEYMGLMAVIGTIFITMAGSFKKAVKMLVGVYKFAVATFPYYLLDLIAGLAITLLAGMLFISVMPIIPIFMDWIDQG